MRLQSYPSLFGTWASASTQVFNSMMEANRAAMSAFRLPEGGRCADNGQTAVGRTDTHRIEAAQDLAEWEVHRSMPDRESLGVGDHVSFTKALDEADVERFAAVSGDTNPVHLDEEWASETRFGGRIVHGTLAAGLISAGLARLPGGVIYLSQDVEFQAPIRIGDRLTAEIEVVEDLGDGRYRLRTAVVREDDATQVIDGEAVVLLVEGPDIEG